MKYIQRAIEKEIIKAVDNFPALILTGPRRSGKTTLLKNLFPDVAYFLIEDPDIIGRIKTDPRTFLEELKPPVILDEIQNVPELLNYIRTEIDKSPSRNGQWLITGSQENSLMIGVTESMAGRAAIFQLLPFSHVETDRVSIFRGGFPEVINKPSVAPIWFRSYIQTYLERDVRSLSAVQDIILFRRFLSLIASRCGQMLNKTDIASSLGISVPCVGNWINILKITGQIILVPPFYENFGKRLVKTPKFYFVDSGLICYLLGIETERMLHNSPFFGHVFEGFIASEILKRQINGGKREEIYYFRDMQGLEVDFIIPVGNKKLSVIEVKASKTVNPGMAEPIKYLSRSISNYALVKHIVHLPSASGLETRALSEGVRAVPYTKLDSCL